MFLSAFGWKGVVQVGLHMDSSIISSFLRLLFGYHMIGEARRRRACKHGGRVPTMYYGYSSLHFSPTIDHAPSFTQAVASHFVFLF